MAPCVTAVPGRRSLRSGGLLGNIAGDLVGGAQSECHKCESAVGHRSGWDGRRSHDKQVRVIVSPPEAVAHARGGIGSHATPATGMVEIVARDMSQYPA